MSRNRKTTGEALPARGRRWWLFAALFAAVAWLAACTPPQTTGSVQSVTIDQEPLTVEVGGTGELTTTVVVTGSAARTVTWSSSNPDVASVSSGGQVTGVAPGNATITATSTVDSTKADSVGVTVIPAGPEEVDPPTLTFSADPEEIDLGDSATLSWTVTGEYDSIRITRPGEVEVSDLEAAGTHDVSPTSTTTYTLEVSYDNGLTVSETARVAVVLPEPDAPVITSFTAQVVPGSQVQLEWVATGGTSWEVFAFGDGPEVSLGAGAGDGSTLTAVIPASDTQNYRLQVWSSATTSSTEEIPGPTTIVTTSADYDRYDASGHDPEEAIPGSLRAVVHTAPAGSVIGFAADVTEIELPGVDIYRGVSPIVDAHLVIDKDLVISGPAGTRISLQGASNQPDGDPTQPLTWHSRMVYVAPGVTVELENLELTGGDFIYFGAGINNAGTLTIRNLRIAENRAFGSGGGIRNAPTGVLSIIDSVIENNGAFTDDDEVGVVWEIRGGPGQLVLPAPEGDGGGIRNEAGGVITIENSQILDNHARYSGGGINNAGTITITDSQVDGNVADFTQYDQSPGEVSYGGGIANGGGATLTMTSGSISNNSAAEQGGGLWQATTALGVLAGVHLEGNVAGLDGVNGYGGGIMHNFYTGEDDNLDHATVTYGPGNIANRGGAAEPSDYEFVDRGDRPDAFGDASIMNLLDYRLAPVPPR